MDNFPDPILRPSTQLSNHFHRLGYCRTQISYTRRGLYFQTFRKEMVSSRRVASGCISDVYPGGRTLRRGKHRLFLWAGREADGSDDSATPSKLGTRDEMGRLEKVCGHARHFQCIDRFRQLVKKYERGDLPKSDWLDNLTFRKMASIHAVTPCSVMASCSSWWFFTGRNSEI
jgi:hypothetical protein